MKTKYFLIVLVFSGTLLLAGCGDKPRVGELRSESQSVELQSIEPVRVEVDFGAGDLTLSDGAQNLMEADFTYNVAKLKPEVAYAGETLTVSQPPSDGWPDMRGIADFRNEWNLRLYGDVPMDLHVNVGGGRSDLKLTDLSLTGLDVKLGAGESIVDLNGDWTRDLDVTIDAGATDLTVRLPSDVGVRVEVDRGPTVIDAPGLAQDGNVYTNDAYGVSDVTLRIAISTGIGWLNLELVDNE